jgi:hypothetical protein
MRVQTMHMRFTVVTVVSALAWMAAGCGKDEVRVYQAPQDAAPVAAADARGGRPQDASVSPASGSDSSRSAAAEAGASERPAVPWTVPAGWEEKPASGMRVASYAVKRPDGRSADISVVAMGGGAGGELENVNRWRDQIGLEPAIEADLAGLRSLIPAGNRQVVVYELDGKKAVLDGKYAARTLAAILPAGEMTVFFKITGENALVAEQKPQFLAWLKSVDTGGGTGGSAEPAPEAPSAASSAPVSSTASAAPAGSAGLSGSVAGGGTDGLPNWQVPSGWKAAGPKPMRLASFDIPDAAGNGDVSISKLNGDGGGLLANVNRWRGQVGLAPLEASALAANSTALTTAGGDSGTWVELKGADKTILGAIVARDGVSWFFKMTAPASVAVQNREAFEKFVRSVRF